MVRCLKCMKEYEEEYDLCPHCGFVRGTPPDEVYHLHPGMILNDRYVVGVVLSFGGFGITYKAWDRNLETVVAIKEYFPTALVNRIPGEMDVTVYSEKQRKEFNNGLTRFLDEARNTEKFSKHPNIVHIFDFFEEHGTAYIVMEFLDGCDLKQYLEEHGGRIDVDETINILLSIISALKAIHDKGFLHRDISPDNIFVCRNRTVKLIDFGAARFSTGEEEKTMTVVLKPGYAPPEQYESRSKQGPWTDIYALGATMYRAITGEVPNESVNRVVEDTLKTPKEIDSSIPDYIDVSLMVAMSITPELRFQNVHQFEDAILNKRKVNTIAEDLKRRKRRRLIGLIAVGMLITIGASVAFTSYHKKKMAAQLEPATISMWVEIDPSHTAEQETVRIDNLLSEFREEYPHVTVQVECIPHEEYDARLDEALKEGALPDLYESTNASQEVLVAGEDISDVLSLLSVGDYYYLKQYEDYFPEGNRIPIGFVVPLHFYNTVLGDAAEPEGNLQSFLDRNALNYNGYSTSYFPINTGMPGEYEVEAQDVQNGLAYSDLWSVSSAAPDENRMAAKRVIYYMLGEQGQDAYFIQTPGALPLNKNELAVYTDVNDELKFIEDVVAEQGISEEHPIITDEE